MCLGAHWTKKETLFRYTIQVGILGRQVNGYSKEIQHTTAEKILIKLASATAANDCSKIIGPGPQYLM